MMVFKRMYVDIPTETHAKLVIEAASCGMSQKALVAELIEERCNKSKLKPKRKAARKKAKRKPARRTIR